MWQWPSGCDFTAWDDAAHVDSVAEQTALIAAMEGDNPSGPGRRSGVFRKDMTSRFAGDVVATVRDSPVDAILADGLPAGGKTLAALATT